MHFLYHHANCADGFAAALIAHAALIARGIPEFEISVTPVNYADPNQMPLGPDDYPFPGDTVTYLDYTPPAATIAEFADYDGVEFTIIDHHEKAAPLHKGSADTPVRFTSIFDLTHSGAALAWTHYNPGLPMPRAVELIEWRDLGHAFQQPDHSNSNSALNLHAFLFRCIPRTFDAWQPVLSASPMDLAHCLLIGAIIRQTDAHIIATAVQNCYWLDFRGQTIPAINGLDAGLISDACTALLVAYPSAPFAASYYIDHKTGKIIYSLRSRAAGHPHGHTNVNHVAQAYDPNGGGHPCAAGFSTLTPIPFFPVPR